MTEQTKNLDYLQSFIDEMKESSSGNYKIETIKIYRFLSLRLSVYRKNEDEVVWVWI